MDSGTGCNFATPDVTGDSKPDIRDVRRLPKSSRAPSLGRNQAELDADHDGLDLARDFERRIDLANV